MAQTTERGPWTGGYTSSVPSFMAAPNQLWGQAGFDSASSSADCVIDPFTGGVSKRTGCAIFNDTHGSEAGLLNASWSAKSRKFVALDSPSMNDGYPVPAVLYSEDTNASFPGSDSGFPGTIYVASSNSGLTTAQKNYSLLEEFSTTHYKLTRAGGETTADYNLKVVPIWIESGDGVYNRGALTGTAGTDKFMQQFLTCGSRSLLQTQNWLYAPNLRATPWRWNKRLNELTNGGSEVVRIFPTGPLPPLFPPHHDTTALSASANDSSWEDGDTFCISCIFQFEDGSFSAPVIPRLPNSTLTSGLGFITVGTIGGTSKYKFLRYAGIPIGPHGTVARIILRTPKQNRAAVTDTVTVEPLDLRIVGILKNNTQTSYLDYGGDDDTLLEDDNVVRVDYTLPRRARYIGTGDQRVVIGYTLPNTAAILLACVNVGGGGANNYDLNTADDEATGTTAYNSSAQLVRITSSQLELHYNVGAPTAPDFTATTGNAKAFAFATYDTLEKLVDAINATTTSSECKQWAAQLAPGIDGTMPSTSLTLTTFDVTATSTDADATLTSSAAFGSVGVGMKVKGGGITTDTYVVSKTDSSSLEMSTAAADPGTGSGTFTFYQETGDNALVSGGTYGYIRSFGPNYPLLLHMKPSAFPRYDKPDKQAIYHTIASPGSNQAGSSMAPNSFTAGNRLVGHSSSRQQMQRTCMGIVDIEGAAVVAYSDGIFLFRNVRGGNTGEDFDCRLFTVNDGRGCISYLGLTSGNGWAAYPTTEGIVATDKTGREFTISGAIFNPSDGTGDLAYEITTSAASAAADTDDQYFAMNVMGSKLYAAIRRSADNPAVFTYDFSPGVEASGLEELLNPNGPTAYIWSPPAIYDDLVGYTLFGALGSIRNASGRVDYLCCDDTGFNGGTAKDGRILTINTGSTDNGSQNYTAIAVVAPLIASPFMSLSPQDIEVTHRSLSGTVSLQFANDQTPTWNSSLSRTLNVSATKSQYQKQVVPIDQQQRGKTDMFWTKWNTTSATSSARLWRIVYRYDETENPNPA